MTQQNQELNVIVPDTPSPDVSSRMARILGALRARREAVEAVEQAQAAELAEEPPVEWALRLMM